VSGFENGTAVPEVPHQGATTRKSLMENDFTGFPSGQESETEER
jgi:hypothetical protein